MPASSSPAASIRPWNRNAWISSFAAASPSSSASRAPVKTTPRKVESAHRRRQPAHPCAPRCTSRAYHHHPAHRRNRAVAELAGALFVAHASPGGKIEQLARDAQLTGKPLLTLDDPANANLGAIGAIPLPAQSFATSPELLRFLRLERAED
jgi:hypothetical protein